MSIPVCNDVKISHIISFGTPVYTAIMAMSDGATQTLEWYGDEIMMYHSDFIGKTYQDVSNLKVQRDIAYLRS